MRFLRFLSKQDVMRDSNWASSFPHETKRTGKDYKDNNSEGNIEIQEEKTWRDV